MKDITIKDIVTCTGGKLITGNENIVCKDIFQRYKNNQRGRHIHRNQRRKF